MSQRSATRTVLVTHSPGLHARPCVAIVNTVRRFASKVRIRSGKEEADAGEILAILALGVPEGAQVTLSAKGPDAEEAVQTLAELFAADFGIDD
ncbi:MAG: HPr family phosphocarrier protein [Thermoguttaceae bacterium]